MDTAAVQLPSVAQPIINYATLEAEVSARLKGRPGVISDGVVCGWWAHLPKQIVVLVSLSAWKHSLTPQQLLDTEASLESDLREHLRGLRVQCVPREITGTAAPNHLPDGGWMTHRSAVPVRQALALGAGRRIMSTHSNVCAVFAGPRQKGDQWTGEAALVVVVGRKGFVRHDECLLSETAGGSIVDVVEGRTYSLGGPFNCNSESLYWPENGQVPGGISISGDDKSRDYPGTLGMVVKKKNENAYYGLTCAHVLQHAGTVHAPALHDVNAALTAVKPCVPIGSASGAGKPNYFYGRVGLRVPYGVVETTVDAALVELADGTQRHREAFRNSAFALSGRIATVSDVAGKPNDACHVTKVGRTTGVTSGYLFDQDLVGNTFYDVLGDKLSEPASVTSPHQRGLYSALTLSPTADGIRGGRHSQFLVVSEATTRHSTTRRFDAWFAAPGDSGSVVVLDNGDILGMVCAGLLAGNLHLTIVTPAESVFGCLDIEIQTYASSPRMSPVKPTRGSPKRRAVAT
jgi:hypothetical protein